MFIKNLDILSPPITFYYQGLLSHSSIISGIISIISMIFIISLAIYFSLDIVKRKEPNALSFNSFTEDAGIFPMNASSLFHFISMNSFATYYKNDGIDFKLFRIIGFETYYEAYLYDKNLSNYDHWLYGKCNNESDTEGISNLINYNFFEKSACIRKYFNSIEQKYYNTEDPKFRWPILAHGTYNKNNQIYNIIIERCNENTIDLILGEGNHCKNFSKFEGLINYSFFGEVFFYFINHYIDILNYDIPYKKYFYTVESLLTKKAYTANHLNFYPSIVKTHNGLILDNIEETKTYIYERKDVFTMANEENDIFCIFILWLQNGVYYHERTYKRIQDVFSSIGGIYQFITIVSIYINSLYNKYIVLSDTETLLYSSINSEKKNHKKKQLKYSELSNIKIEDPKIKKSKKDIKKDYFREKNNTENPNNKNTKNKKENSISFSNQNCITSYENININFNKQNNINNKNINNNFKKHHTLKKIEIKYFLDFLLFKISCRKKKKFFNAFRNFRIKIISEEHLVRNHLNIYNLLRVTEKKRLFKRNSYHFKDLINLV